jgi:hypothetical protein
MQGYVAVGFTQRPGKMFPADAVIGSSGPNGAKYVQSYKILGYSVHNPKDVTPGWAGHMGLISSGSNGTTTLCFSRPITTVSAQATPSLTPTSLPIIWAVSKSGDVRKHDFQGALVLDVEARTSQVLVVGGDGQAGRRGRASAADLAHGVLMMVAFVVLMPGAVLLARHKWLFGSKKVRWGWGVRRWPHWCDLSLDSELQSSHTAIQVGDYLDRAVNRISVTIALGVRLGEGDAGEGGRDVFVTWMGRVQCVLL